MVAYTVLFNLLLLLGIGSIVGCFVAILIVIEKLNKINQNMNQLNNKLSKINWNNIDNKSNNSEDLNNQARTVKNSDNITVYQNESKPQITALKKESDLQENKIKNDQDINSANEQSPKSEIGIVFCRNCASQYTSDKDSCPICGAKRQQ